MDNINFYEFLGVMMGDGCLLYYPQHRIYGIEITGNADEEKDYYEQIARFLKEKYSLKCRIYTKYCLQGKSLKLVVYNKSFADLLIGYGLYPNKTYTVKILPHLVDWEISKYIIKGIFETDGSFYFSKSQIKINAPTYPRLEIKTASFGLAEQLVKILNSNGFIVNSHQNGSTRVIYMSGKKMLEKWVQEIGFSSMKNKTKYLLWKKLGYYVPRITLSQRIVFLMNKSEKII